MAHRVSKKMRAAVIERDGSYCQVKRACTGRNILHTEAFRDDYRLTIDHIKLVKDGGTNDLINLRVACRLCNTTRQYKEKKVHARRWWRKGKD